MRDDFDYEEFDKRIRQEYSTYQMNLKYTEVKKEAALLHANHFQDCLKNLMESILQTKEGRRIPIKIIISILNDRNTLSAAKAEDAAKMCDIRDWFTHRVNLKSIENDAEEVIETIDIQLSYKKDTTHNEGTTAVTTHKNTDRGDFDLYEKIDLICSDLSRIARNEALHHNSRPKTNHPT